MTSEQSRSAAVEVAASLLGERAQREVALGPLTTYRVGGPAALFAVINSDAALRVVATAVARSGVPVVVLGRGSNVLVADAGFDGLVLSLGAHFATVRVDGSVVRAGAAVPLPVVARRSVAAGLQGFEWAVGVPGSVGGAVRMNAGGHGSDMAATLTRVHVLDLHSGEDGWVPTAALDLGYRRSSLGDHQLVLAAELALAPGDRHRGEALLSEIVQWRRDHQPGGANAGSVFTNPPDDSAGRLIEAAGAKGLRLGTARVSDKHANFIQADEGGRADDVYALMGEVADRVWRVSGVRLHPETRLIGFGVVAP